MGKVQAVRRSATPAAVAALLLAVAIIVALGVLARPAAAQTTFTQCSTCHDYAYGDAYHTATTHKAQTCATCHVNGSGKAGLVPSACVSCHGAASTLIATAPHQAPGASCATTDGCHGYTAPPTQATTTLTAKAAPTTVKVGKKVKVSGLAAPVPALASAKVAFKVERKVGTKWTKMKTGTATTLATGAYTWTYKTTKKGAHRVTVSIAKTATFTAKSLVKTFKVK